MSMNANAFVPFAEELAACQSAQRVWSMLTVPGRLAAVRRFRHLLVSRWRDLAEAIATDIGKSPTETLACEVLPVAEACKFLERRARKILRSRKESVWRRPVWLGGGHEEVHRRPRGVIGIIGTWNYPLFLNAVQILQALTAGNGVLWKPSEVAPASAAALQSAFHDAGFPDGLFQCLPSTREAGKHLSEANVDHIIFTGHADTGRKLAAALGQRLISSTLELSGLDAMFVLADADVNLAAKAAWFGATLNGGQTCLAVRRAFVARPIYQPFLDALSVVSAQRVPSRLATTGQSVVATRLIDAAIAAGAKPLDTDTNSRVDGDFTPVILMDVRPDMAICREATFAPLLCVLPFDHIDDAIAAQSQCPYRLGASLFTNNREHARDLARRIPAGMVIVNDVIAETAHPATPFGGYAASGWGVTQGVEGLLDMTVPHTVSYRSGRWRPHFDPPNTTKWTSQRMLAAMLRWSHAPSWWQRVKGMFSVMGQVVRGFPKTSGVTETEKTPEVENAGAKAGRTSG